MATTVLVSKTAAVGLTAGQLVALDNNAGVPGVFLADANGIVHLQHAVGFANNTVLAGAAVNVLVAGEQLVPDAFWDAVPLVANVGANVFMSETAGHVTLTAPTTAADVNQKVGVVGTGGAGVSTVICQIGDGVVIT